MPLNQKQYSAHFEKTARFLADHHHEGRALAKNIDSLRIPLEEKSELLRKSEQVVADVFHSGGDEASGAAVLSLRRISDKAAGKTPVVTPASFAKLLNLLAARTRDCLEVNTRLQALEDLSKTSNFSTPAHFEEALALAGKKGMTREKFSDVTALLRMALHAGTITSAGHLRNAGEALDELHQTLRTRSIPFSREKPFAPEGVGEELLKTISGRTSGRLNASQFNQLVDAVKATVEAGGQREDALTLMRRVSSLAPAQTPQQITRTLAALSQAARKHGAKEATALSGKLIEEAEIGDEKLLAVSEKALQKGLRPNKAIEVYASALESGKKEGAAVEEGLEQGVLLGPLGRKLLHEEPFSRKKFLADARKNAVELAAREPKNEFERELKQLHY